MSVVKNTTYLTLAYVAQKILSLGYFVMIARLIGVEDVGKYSFALAFTTLFAVFIDLGLTQTLIRDVAQSVDRAKAYVSTILSVKLVVGIVVYGVVVALINVMGYPPVTRHLVYLSGIVMVLDSLTLTMWGAFRGNQQLKYESLCIVINQIIVIAAGFLILALRLPLIYLMIPFILGSLWSLIFSIVMMERTLSLRITLGWDRKLIVQMLKVALPFALLGIFTRVYGNLDSVMLSKLQGDTAVGLYATALKIPFALQFIPSAFAAAIFPAFSKYFIHDKSSLQRSFEESMKLLTLVVVPIAFGIFSIAPEAIGSVFGKDFMPAVAPLQILVMGLIFVFLNFPLGSLMNGCGKHVTNTTLVGITMVVNVTLNIILIPHYSFVGAAIAFIISHSFLFTAGLVVSKRITPYRGWFLVSVMAKCLLSAVVMTAVIMFGKNYVPWYAMIPIGGLVYVTLVYIVKGFTRDDVVYLKQAIFKRNA